MHKSMQLVSSNNINMMINLNQNCENSSKIEQRRGEWFWLNLLLLKLMNFIRKSRGSHEITLNLVSAGDKPDSYIKRDFGSSRVIQEVVDVS